MCSGSTTAGSTNWEQYSSNAISVAVDTSSCGFSATPVYVTSLGGGSASFVTTGSSEVYDETASGFTIYIYTTTTPAEANTKGWHINWIAHPVGPLSDSSSASCAGRTTSGSTSWTYYNSNGFYVDVDTTSCGFDATPVYITSMGGGNSSLTTTGSSEVYLATNNGFRIFINTDGNVACDESNCDEPNTKGWYIMWVAQPSGQQDHGGGVSCAGESGSSNWNQYNNYGIYVDVDTSSCGFSATPVYVTSMSGTRHWQTTGSSEPYTETDKSFRTYIRQDDGITTSEASSWGWSVNWIADEA